MPHDLYGASPDGVDPQGAYARFTSMVDPNAPKEEMEAAITEAYGHVPGFEEAYKESVKIDGRWYDLVGAYGSPKASFHGMMLKEETPSSDRYQPMTMASLADPMSGVQSYTGSAPRGGASPVASVSRAAYVPLAGERMSDLALVEPVMDLAFRRTAARDPAFRKGEQRDPAFREYRKSA
jgi:hypothetical protein